MKLSASLVALLVAVGTANAANLIVNGGFETGDLTGWTATSTEGTGGFSATSQTYTPVSGNATVGPHSGSYYAVSDDFGPQTAYLTQTFTTPSTFNTDLLSFSIFVNDVYGGAYGSAGPGGQVNLLTSAGTLIAVLYGPADTFENPIGQPNPYVNETINITSYLARSTTYQLQIQDTETSGTINVGVDDISLQSATPEPATLLSTALLGGLILWCARRKRLSGRS